MNDQPSTRSIRDIRQRAAEVRRNWAPSERALRTGLPPDMPARLRDQLLGRSPLNWPAKSVGEITAWSIAGVTSQWWPVDLAFAKVLAK